MPDVDSASASGADPDQPSQAPLRRLAHISDVHFGKIADDGVVSALVDEINAQSMDLVVVSGDLTQRATREQFSDAKAFLDRFTAPVLVVPGNHDVRAWWHDPYDRVFRSAKRFKKYITSDLTPTFNAPGLSVFGLNSAHGLTIKGGKIRARHLAAMTRYFEEQASGDLRVLVLHHHLLHLNELGDHDIARGARRALVAAEEADVDLILCGHLHRSHVAHVRLAPDFAGTPGHRLIVASAGTATSSRGRGEDRAANHYNWIHIWPDRFEIQERRYERSDGAFGPLRATSIDRT